MKKNLFKVAAVLLAVASFSGCAKKPETVIPKKLFEVTYVVCNDHDGYTASCYHNVVSIDEAKVIGEYAYDNIGMLCNITELDELRNGIALTFNALDISEEIIKHKDDVLYSDVIVTAENIISRAYGK